MTHRTGIAKMIVAAFAAILLGSGMAFAASIVGSAHDFSEGNTTGSTYFAGVFYVDDGSGFPLYIKEICVFCHTPHGAANPSGTPSPYLWNRVSSPPATYSYQMYTSTTVSTGNLTAPTGISLMCMSCHDGVTSIAVNSLQNAPGTGNPQVFVDTAMISGGSIYNAYAGAPPTYWGANIGEATPTQKTINMSNDHPISFTWNYSKPDLYAAPQNPALRLFNGKLECATCHLVHDPAIPPFLAMSNGQSAMCMACHNK